nr:ulp1 protease family, C-terminal catalytic domain-containing protein [Tanacetum cinerariifolium]
MIADGTIHIAGQDPLTRVLGPDQPRLTREKSSVVGKKKGLGNADVRKRKACKLIIEWFGTEKIVAKGQVYPGRGGILHGLPIEPGFIKVQVDSIEEGCLAFPIARPTDEVKTLHDALGSQFIQWPRKYIRIEEPLPSKAIKRAMAKLPNRPQKIQALANRFINHKDRNEQIHVTSPDGMYGKIFYESVEYESLLGWMTHDWIDGTILHWWCMHLFEMVSKEEFNTCAFFNPMINQGRVCDQESNFAIKHILAIVEAHRDKEIFLAPYLQDSHWVLFLICPKTRTGYILDSYNRDKRKTSNSFYLSNTVERIIAMTIRQVDDFYKIGTWERSGYLVAVVGALL